MADPTGGGASIKPVLAGRTVALTRSPERAGAMLAALESAGAEAVLVPVIDFEIPADTDEFDTEVLRLAGGGFDWLVVTSVTTVRALVPRPAALGLAMDRVVPGSTRVAAVGATTRRALEAEGIGVDLVPVGESSAQGLLDDWPDAGAGAGAGSEADADDEAVSVLLPQADIADPALRDGLRHRGADVAAIPAYHTVNYPARPEHRLVQPLAMAAESQRPASVAVLSAAEFAARQQGGKLDAVVLTSPSAARRVREECSQWNSLVKVVAIGRPTSAEAVRCGFPVAAVAPEPTPEGIVTALEQAFAAGQAGAREEPEPSSTKEQS